ncbi:MAG: hypothetical protein J6V95_05615 [Bacteroidaceae bacterium]|nr:hypothetical protein [Bacteroidaceae bacterium]
MDNLKRTFAFCGIIAAFCLGSCISTSDEIDLNKDISLDVQIGRGGISVPIGSLSKIYLDSLIKSEGDDALLDTLDGGLFGFSMDDSIEKVEIEINSVKIGIPNPEIDKIITSFDAPTQDDLTLEIPKDSNMTTLKVASINLSEINEKLPKFNIPVHAEAPVNIPVKDYVIPKEVGVIPVPTQNQSIVFSYNLPEDVSKLNTVYFGETGTTTGQKVSLNVDLGGLYDILNNPDLTINSLSILFPDNFVLGKDSNLDGYFSSGSVQVNGNSFVISNADVKTISGTSKILPISFYIKSADFGDYGTNIDYSGTISYGLTLGVGGTTKQAGKLYVDVNLKSDLQMADFSVNTNEKVVTLDPNSISSSCEIGGLDGMESIEYIVFKNNLSYFDLSLSDFSIEPFQFGTGSNITLVFSDDFVFDKEYSLGGKGTWINDGVHKNALEIYPAQAKGKTITLHLDSLLLYKDVDKLNSSITLDNDVAYSASIRIAAKNELHATDLEQLSDKNIKFKVSGNLVIDDARFVNSEITTDLDQTTSISVNEDIDESLMALSSIDFQDPAGVYMKLKFKGVPGGIEDMTLSNFTIRFPEFLAISYSGDDNIKISKDGHSLVINKVLTQTELADDGTGFILDGLKIEGMEFAKPLRLADGKLILDDSVKITGKAMVGNNHIGLAGLDDIEVTPTVSFDSIYVKSVTGKVNPTIDPIVESVSLDLGDDADFLKDASLKLKDPRIAINLTSSVTVPIKLDLSLSSKKSDGTPIAENITPDDTIYLPACALGEESRTTTLIIGQAVQSSESGDTIFVGMSRFSNLIEKIPDSIKFELNAYADTTIWHTVDLKTMSVEGDYKVTIPLSFDSLFVSYSDTIKDLGADLKDFADKVMEDLTMELRADSIISTIPLGVKLKATALDEQGVPVPEITVDSCVIAAGNDEGRLLEPMVLKLYVEKGGLEKLDAFQFTAECQSDDTNSDGAIKKGQYLHVKGVKLKFPQGIVLDLSEKKKEDK